MRPKPPPSLFKLLLPLAAALLLFGMFPFGWLAEQWPALDQLLSLLFGTTMAHVAGHFGLFVLLGSAVLLLFPLFLRHPAAYFALMLAFGLFQEFLQLVSFKQRPIVFDDLFDVAVDLAGALVALLLVRLFAKFFPHLEHFSHD